MLLRGGGGAAFLQRWWRRQRGGGGVAHTSRSTSLPRLFQPATPKKRNLKWSFCWRTIANEFEHNVQSWKKILSKVIKHYQIKMLIWFNCYWNFNAVCFTYFSRESDFISSINRFEFLPTKIHSVQEAWAKYGSHNYIYLGNQMKKNETKNIKLFINGSSLLMFLFCFFMWFARFQILIREKQIFGYIFSRINTVP